MNPVQCGRFSSPTRHTCPALLSPFLHREQHQRQRHLRRRAPLTQPFFAGVATSLCNGRPPATHLNFTGPRTAPGLANSRPNKIPTQPLLNCFKSVSSGARTADLLPDTVQRPVSSRENNNTRTKFIWAKERESWDGKHQGGVLRHFSTWIRLSFVSWTISACLDRKPPRLNA